MNSVFRQMILVTTYLFMRVAATMSDRSGPTKLSLIVDMAVDGSVVSSE